MLKDAASQEQENVFGDTYKNAQDAFSSLEFLIKDRVGKGFISREQCEQFVKDNHIGIAVYMKSLGSYRYVNHLGDALTKDAWMALYRSVLFWTEEDKKGKQVTVHYDPSSDYNSLRGARIYGELSDGKYEPLYERNYFTPTGSYNEATSTYNIAKPITTFAKETGADTSHIHLLLQKIAGECYPYLLAWLRAKMVSPTRKTEVVPIFVGRQGTGKSTFGDAICMALFSKDNVIVTDQFDSTARFNSDNADALIICIEEKTQDDKRNTSSNLKARATAKRVRKENKGVDPIFQDSHTDFILTTNELVPLKFEDRGNQRRFMVMEVDDKFTRDASPLADAVFTKLYGFDGDGNQIGKGLVDNKALIEQFKYELATKKGFEDINYRKFPKTAAYHRCFSIPRNNDMIMIEDIIKAITPYIVASLRSGEVVTRVQVEDEELNKHDVYLDQVCDVNAFQYHRHKGDFPNRLAVCRNKVFFDAQRNQSLPHSMVERALLDMREHFKENGIILRSETACPVSGFRALIGKDKYSPTAWFMLAEEDTIVPDEATDTVATSIGGLSGIEVITQESGRIGTRVRYNNKFVYDEHGEFETLNELKPGCIDRKAENAQYLDTFLLEADDTSPVIMMQELRVLSQGSVNRASVPRAEELYAQRLAVQDAEATRLFNTGVICRAVYSGSKSIHMLIRVADSPSDIEERRWLFSYLTSTLSSKLNFDPSVHDPTRLTRAPITMVRLSTIPSYDDIQHEYAHINKDQQVKGQQRLLVEDWSNIYQLNWRPIYEAWKLAPPAHYEQRGKMLPSKPIYRQAAVAILEGKFFTDKQWNGARNELFFPAYRLLRMNDYTHDELWEEIYDQLKGYKKTQEIPYWQTRKVSKIIRDIDEAVDNE